MLTALFCNISDLWKLLFLFHRQNKIKQFVLWKMHQNSNKKSNAVEFIMAHEGENGYLKNEGNSLNM